MKRARKHPHVIIVGGGFGGLEVAKRLRKARVDVTLIDRTNHHLFQPLLYQVATAGLSPEQIAAPIRSLLSDVRNCDVLLDTVVQVNTARRRVGLESGATLDYDYLVLAAGAKVSFFGNESWRHRVFQLKTLQHAMDLRRRVISAFELANREKDPRARRRLTSFVVVGGGPLGVELAGALAELGRQTLAQDYPNIGPDDVSVTLVEMSDRVLSPFHPSLSDAAKRQLEELGVIVRTSTRVHDVHSDAVVTSHGPLEASTVCWAPGVEAVELSYRLDAERAKDGRLKVGVDCSLPGHPNVFALGDIARFVPLGNEEPLPALAPVALQQGRHVAECIKADLESKERKPFEYIDKGIMATIGRSRAVAEKGPLRLSGFLAWAAWLLVHLYFLVGFRNRFMVLMSWSWSYFTVGRGARVIIDDAPRLFANGARPRRDAVDAETHAASGEHRAA